jgi:hypothetical protein
MFILDFVMDKRYELQWRFNFFFSSSILAGSFSGLLVYGISKYSWNPRL